MLDYSDFYDPDFGYDAIISDETAKTIEKYVEKGTSILDIGCGTGRVSSRFRSNKITLLDQSKKYLEIASKKVNLENIMQGKFLDLNIDKKIVEKLNQLAPKINDYSAMKLLIVSN